MGGSVMESKILTLPVVCVTSGDTGKYKIQPSNFWGAGEGFDARFHLNVDAEDSVFYDVDVEEGALFFQEYFYDRGDIFYFDVTEDGELVGVLPEGWDGEIDNETGEFIAFPEDTVFEGINFWIIEDTFVVQ